MLTIACKLYMPRCWRCDMASRSKSSKGDPCFESHQCLYSMPGDRSRLIWLHNEFAKLTDQTYCQHNVDCNENMLVLQPVTRSSSRPAINDHCPTDLVFGCLLKIEGLLCPPPHGEWTEQLQQIEYDQNCEYGSKGDVYRNDVFWLVFPSCHSL